jgi:hypothetical protein
MQPGALDNWVTSFLITISFVTGAVGTALVTDLDRGHSGLCRRGLCHTASRSGPHLCGGRTLAAIGDRLAGPDPEDESGTSADTLGP